MLLSNIFSRAAQHADLLGARGQGAAAGTWAGPRPDQRQWELEKTAALRKADRERQVRKRLAEARLTEAELEVQAQNDEHAELGK